MAKNNLADTIEHAIHEPALHDSAASIMEVMLDTGLDEGILREIPLVNLVLGIGRVTATIHDRLFINKLCHFLHEFESVPATKREKMIADINESPKNEIKVGEKLLYIIERCQDHSVSRNIGRIFKAYLEGEITYDDFVRLSVCIDKLLSNDLNVFLNNKWEFVPVFNASPYIGTGLVNFDEIYISVEDEWDRDMGRKYRVEGGEQTVSITELGQKLKKVLG